MLTKILSKYLSCDILKFLCNIFIFILLFKKLTDEEYAIHGIIQSILFISSLLILFNFESSYQKLFSKNYITKFSNSTILIHFILGLLSYSLIFIIFFETGSFGFDSNILLLPIISLYLLTVSNCFHNLLLSYTNACKYVNIYMLQNLLPNLLVLFYLLLKKNISYNDFISFYVFSYISTSILTTFLLSRIIEINFNYKKFKLLSFYILNYTYLSVPTLGSKYVLDLVLRFLILNRCGISHLVTYNFSLNIISMFRSVESSIFRAVTPLIMNDNYNSKLNKYFYFIIIMQSVLTLIIFSLVFYWIDIVKLIFPNKDEALFSPTILFLLSIVLIISYWKNYFMSYLKKNLSYIKYYFIQSFIANLLILLSIYLFCYEINQFLYSYITLLFLNLIVLIIYYNKCFKKQFFSS